MRNGIRQYLIDNVEWVTDDNIFEPHIPNKRTEKPFIVVEQLEDTEKTQGSTGSERRVNIWIYQERTSFKELDRMVKDVVSNINYKPIHDNITDEYFTCIYKGAGNDIVDIEWDIIARPLTFTIIALNKTDEYSADREVEVFSQYLKKILKNEKGVEIKVFKDYWNQDFTIPSVLVRVDKTERKSLINNLIQIDKSFKIHVIDKDPDMIIHIMEHIENKLMIDEEIYYDSNSKKIKYLLSRLVEDRDSDMFNEGQIIATLRYYVRGNNNNNNGVYNRIYDDKGLKIRKETL